MSEWRELIVKRRENMACCASCQKVLNIEEMYWLPSAIRVIRDGEYKIMDVDVPVCEECTDKRDLEIIE